MENNFVPSLCLFSFVLLALPLSFKDTHTQHNSLSAACVVTNFSGALDFGLREGEN